MMKIGEVAKHLGISTSAIRFYERLGLLAKSTVKRAENGYRVYDSRDVEVIALICKLKDFGFELEEIRGLLLEESNSCGDLISSIDLQIQKYRSMSRLIMQRIERLEFAKNRCQSNCAVENKAKNCCR